MFKQTICKILRVWHIRSYMIYGSYMYQNQTQCSASMNTCDVTRACGTNKQARCNADRQAVRRGGAGRGSGARRDRAVLGDAGHGEAGRDKKPDKERSENTEGGVGRVLARWGEAGNGARRGEA